MCIPTSGANVEHRFPERVSIRSLGFLWTLLTFAGDVGVRLALMPRAHTSRRTRRLLRRRPRIPLLRRGLIPRVIRATLTRVAGIITHRAPVGAGACSVRDDIVMHMLLPELTVLCCQHQHCRESLPQRQPAKSRSLEWIPPQLTEKLGHSLEPHELLTLHDKTPTLRV